MCCEEPDCSLPCTICPVREMDQMNQDFLGEFSSEERKLLQNLLTTLAGWKQAEHPTATR